MLQGLGKLFYINDLTTNLGINNGKKLRFGEVNMPRIV